MEGKMEIQKTGRKRTKDFFHSPAFRIIAKASDLSRLTGKELLGPPAVAELSGSRPSEKNRLI